VATRDVAGGVGVRLHDFGVTHIDALCHVFKDDRMYNGLPTSEVQSTGVWVLGRP
jgi:hypothetical protein